MTNFEKYFKSLQSHKIDDITEHSHRAALKDLIESIAGTKLKILHEPKREGKFGSPDFKITHVESIIGYIENKKIEENLDRTIKSDQIRKYQSLSDNILLTNYIDWIWLKEGKIQKRENLCFLNDVEDKKAKLDKAKVDAIDQLIKSFLSQAPKEISDAKKLAEALAVRAKLLKDFLLEELKRQEIDHTEGKLYQLYETFKNFVFHELTVGEFSDAFAQNLVYGLFLARLNANTQIISLYNAKQFIPSSFELIRELVHFLDELYNDEYRETRWIVEEVLTIMNNLDLKAIQETLSFTKKRKDANNFTIKDPYVYFYEDFLAAYDKKLRKAKGVYYTPPPVVNFIVRAIDDILKDTFKIKDGLADNKKVTVLDFATGTGTFLVEILQQIFEKLPKDSGKKDLLIKEHVLKNLFGFEYLIAPYTIAHLKLSQFLKDNDYELKPKERLQVYLTNTLEPIPAQIKIPLLPALTDENKHAQEIKDKPILVITGNPPYSIHSKNNGDWIKQKIEAYKIVDGEPIKDKGLNGLQDDYVKFIRFAQDKIDKVDDGIVGIITNHTFSFSSTYRGMRQSLMKTFDQIYFIDLHGNNILQEKSPDGSKDENVFDIEQGVGISFFVKKKGLEKKVVHSNIWGSRANKYKDCLNLSIGDLENIDSTPHSPFYSFKPITLDNSKNYNLFPSVLEIFKIKGSGIKFRKDNLLVRFEREDVKQMLRDIESLSKEKLFHKYNFSETPDWKFDEKKGFFSSKDTSSISPVFYRPFDLRYTYYPLAAISKIIPRGDSRATLMNNFLNRENLALCIGKAGNVIPEQSGWNLAYCTNAITDMNIFYRGGATIFLFNIEDSNRNILSNINEQYNFTNNHHDSIGYIYSILYSPTYRSKYAEFLKIDFPRIPFIAEIEVFKQLANLGNALIQAHLLSENLVTALKEKYSFAELIGKGNYIVDKATFLPDEKAGKLYINTTQYFENIPIDVYEFYIGGYQVIDKYLKDRKGRALTLDELDNIKHTAYALAFTIEQMNIIDEITKLWI